jgi:uncharacterized damage-inducible protein DinB
MTTRELVLDHLVHTFEKEAWQPSLAMAVEGLTAAQAAWKPGPRRHSIWQIVRHITLWKQAVLDALDGRVPSERALEQADWPEVSGDDAAWQADVCALHAVSQQLIARAAVATDEEMARPAPTYQEYPGQVLAVRLVRTFTHDSYHAGQIRYLRALQGKEA